jgi:hypothetical protein
VLSVPRKFQEEGLLMAPMRDVPDLTGQKMAVAAGHRFSLKRAFGLRKPASKRFYTPNITTLFRKINVICWSDRDFLFTPRKSAAKLARVDFDAVVRVHLKRH